MNLLLTDSDRKFQLKGNTMILFACALDKRGVHPKIAAWDSGLYVREDGRKSNTSVFDDPIKPHERLLDKMMIRFTRKENGLGAIVQLQPV